MIEPIDAIGLISGGLDSILALHLILEQGLNVEAMHVVLPVHGPEQRAAVERIAAQLGVPLHLVALEEAFFERLRHPDHGYGAGMNPCLDCRILVLSEARERMEEVGAAFVFTGEVVGERPMSQNLQALSLVERRSGLESRLLRPLSAKLLPPTIPEQEGLVDRSRLLDIRGRSRKPQFALAQQYGLADFPSPGGGCVLTDAGFSRRVRDLLAHRPDFGRTDFELLKIGRHFRLSPQAKAVSGRNEAENRRIIELAGVEDLLFEVRGVGSPVTLLRGPAGETAIEESAAITARYSDAAGPYVVVHYGRRYPYLDRTVTVEPARGEWLDRVRV